MKRLTKEEIELLEKTRSQMALKYFREKTDVGEIENADEVLDYTGPCGDTMKVYLKMNNEKIEDIKFQYEGCSGTACCGSALCELVKNKTIQEAKKTTPEDILKHLGASPIKDFDCPLLAVRTLEKVIEKYESNRGNKL